MRHAAPRVDSPDYHLEFVESLRIWLRDTPVHSVGAYLHPLPVHGDVQPVETVGGLFNVGGQAMGYPGDISNGASPSNTINCRCAIGYDPY